MDLASELYGEPEQSRDLAMELYGDTPPVPVKLGKEGFKDAMMQTLQEQSRLPRNVASMGLQLSKAWQGLKGGDDPMQIQGADVAAREAPVGAFVGDVVKYSPAMLAGGVLAPAAVVAGIAGATTPGGAGERVTAAGIEGGTALGVGAGVKALAAGAKAIGNMGSLAKARQALEDIIGTNNMPEALRLARAAPAGVSAEQALVSMNNPNVANLARITHGLNPESAAAHAELLARQQTGRTAAMQGVTPDLVAAEAARTAAAQPLYKAADKTVVTLDGPMMDLFSRMPPGTLEAAKNIARMEGRPFVMGEFVPAHSVPTGVLGANGQPFMQQVPAQFPKITGESLHYIKRALSDISNAVDPTKGIGRDAQQAARSVMDDFIPAIEDVSRNPVYGEARRAFAAGSVPVNQSKVLTAMTEKLQTPVGRDNPSVFLNTMGTGEQAMLKRSTGFPRYDSVADVLNPRQLGVVSKVADELQRNATLTQHRASEGSAKAVFERLKTKGLASLIPNILYRPAMIAHAGLKEGEAEANRAMMRQLEVAMRDPQKLQTLLETLPVEQRNTVVKLLTRFADSGVPAVAGGTIADLVQ